MWRVALGLGGQFSCGGCLYKTMGDYRLQVHTHERPKHLLGVRHRPLPFEEEGIYEEHPDHPNTGLEFCEKNNFPNSSKEGLVQVNP